jgi:hypothetical protein
MTDRELLEQLFKFLSKRRFVEMEGEALLDMVRRYKNPPLTRVFPVGMQMSQHDYKRLGDILKRIQDHLNPASLPVVEFEPLPDLPSGISFEEKPTDDPI